MEDKNIVNKQEVDGTSLKEILLDLYNLYRYLLSNWIIILFLSITGAALGLAYSLYKKPIYTATTTFVLEESDKGGGMGQVAGLASMAGIDIGGSGGGGIFQGDNILELYKSRTMIQKTLLTRVEFKGKKQLLIDHFITFNELRKKWASQPELKDITFDNLLLTDTSASGLKFTRLQDSVVSLIVDDINKNYLNVIKPDKKLSIIKADIRSKDEFFAKEFNQQIVKNVSNFYIQTKTKKSLANIFILQQKTDSVRAVLNGAIFNAAIVADATPNLNVTRQVQRVAPVQRSQFTAESNKVILAELVKNLELSKISLRKETPLIQVIDEPIYPLEKERLGKAKGIVTGAFLAGFLVVLFLILKRTFKNIMA